MRLTDSGTHWAEYKSGKWMVDFQYRRHLGYQCYLEVNGVASNLAFGQHKKSPEAAIAGCEKQALALLGELAELCGKKVCE